MPKIQWPHYAENLLASLCRKPAGLITPPDDTPGGRERVVGAGLNRLATDPGAAMRNMGQAEEIVPGSVPTTAQASRDVGLLSTERAMQGADPAAGGRLAQRFAEQNRARIGALDELAKDPAALELAKSQRRALIGPLYEKAFQDFKGAPQSPAIQEVMTKLKGSPAIAKAQQLARLEGLDLNGPSQSLKGLHYLKLAIDDMLDRSFESGLGRTEQRALISVRDQLTGAMEKASPMYELARGSFAQASRPINQMEALQEVRGRVLNPGTTATGENIMSQAKWYNAVTRKSAELGETLSKEQVSVLERIGKDLDRGALSQSAGKAAGSNTFQNLSSANVIGAVLGGKAAGSPTLLSIARPLQWIYKLPDQAAQDLMFEAMLDPRLASQLMSKASPAQMAGVSGGLYSKALAMGYGSLLGAEQATRPQPAALGSR